MGGSAAVITLDCNISADSVTLLWPLTSALILNIEIVFKRLGTFWKGPVSPWDLAKTLHCSIYYLMRN